MEFTSEATYLCLWRFLTTNSISWIVTGPFILYISHRMIFGSLDFSWSLSVLSKLLNYWTKSLNSFLLQSFDAHRLNNNVFSHISGFDDLRVHFLAILFIHDQSDYRFLNYNGLLKLASLTFFFPVFYLMDLSLSFLFSAYFGYNLLI